jgi:hypothetical protein
VRTLRHRAATTAPKTTTRRGTPDPERRSTWPRKFRSPRVATAQRRTGSLLRHLSTAP